jgi:hypothetical protein
MYEEHSVVCQHEMGFTQALAGKRKRDRDKGYGVPTSMPYLHVIRLDK